MTIDNAIVHQLELIANSLGILVSLSGAALVYHMLSYWLPREK